MVKSTQCSFKSTQIVYCEALILICYGAVNDYHSVDISDICYEILLFYFVIAICFAANRNSLCFFHESGILGVFEQMFIRCLMFVFQFQGRSRILCTDSQTQARAYRIPEVVSGNNIA